jgi:phosphoribosylaminoimidazolecarboxamide formyltransferase/IMP cyclohydrolase
MQDADVINHAEDLFENWRLVSGPPADENTARNLQFAWRAAATARSNAVVIVNELKSIGMGAGSVSRIDAAQLAIRKAQQFSSDYLLGSVAASDAFFPFPDGVEALIAAGVKAIVQPGGSLKDEAVIKAAQTAGITMYLTGMRHFSH